MQKEKIIDGLKFFVFLAIGVGLFYHVYKEQDFGDIMNVLQHVHWPWVALSLVISSLSHVSRAVRWRILIRSMGQTPKLSNTIFAVYIMYFVNLAIPRMGEVTRCGILKKYDKIPFPQLLGTVFLERLVDMIMLLLLTGFVVYNETDVLLNFLEKTPELRDKVAIHFTPVRLLLYTAAGIALLVGAIQFVRKSTTSSGLLARLRGMIIQFTEGIQTIYKMEQKFWFVFHSMLIWAMYFFMLYFSFWAFDFSEHLPVSAGIVVFVISSYGMVAPAPGGIGAWHFMVIGALSLYSIVDADSGAFALVVHSGLTLSLMVTGAVSVILLPIFNRKTVDALEAEKQ